MLLACSRALLRRRSCIRQTRCRALSPSYSSHQTTEPASSEVRVTVSMPGAGRPAPMSNATQRDIPTVSLVSICANW